LSHVFEHLHKPRQAAEEIFRLLRADGRVWLSQPNLDSVGLSIFGEFWRGLEAPRHLSLHTRKSLTRLLNETGFVDIQIVPAEPRATFCFQQSLSMRHLLNPQQTPIPPIGILAGRQGRPRQIKLRAVHLSVAKA
jgi:2-polyprenyl-3-methyl-5-hydroxy-6-metoxy-1,4-benzoquinol methylase